MRSRCLILGVIVVVLFIDLGESEANAQAPSIPPSAMSFAGCYELKLGRWWPWSFGEDNQFVTPPSKIQLIPQQGTDGFEKYGFVIRQIPPAKGGAPGRRRSSFWLVKSDNNVQLIWTNGLSGVSLNLGRHGDKLRGWAHPHFDFPMFIPRIMHVTALRIACDSIAVPAEQGLQ
jgi:hypothetical protein